MLAKLKTHALVGIDAVPVDVEVDSAAGLPKTILVGLPEQAVRESVHRIERALANLHYQRPKGRTIINLAPADLPKAAGAFDLPIALGMLVATGQLLPEQLAHCSSVGELALDGSVRPIKGALSVAMSARDQGLRKLYVPQANAREAAVVEGIEVYGVQTLGEAVGLICGTIDVAPLRAEEHEAYSRLNQYPIDYSDVRGQEFAKRALVIAAAAGHNVLMIGSPGTGKTMLAQRLPTILPPLSPAESLETTRIYSAVGRLPPGEALLTTRPFRSPHHTISDAGMVGGGSTPAPGEISMAHNGVLFLDELPEFNRKTLEVLRQPLEERAVTISRALSSVTFPSNIILVSSMNPCPCGYLGDLKRICKCSPQVIERYMGKISGPLLDRIDIHLEVPSVSYQELSSVKDGTTSATMREQVLKARAVQLERFPDGTLNARMGSRQLRKYCAVDAECRALLQSAIEDLGLSARAHDRILRLARTIADMDCKSTIGPDHLSEAIGYRSLDRRLWMR